MRWQMGEGRSVDAFLEATEIVDWTQPEVLELAQTLARPTAGPVETARRCFEWVRDEIKHSADHRRNPVTCSASEVLRHGTGFCYAKSHLLAALLRANAIPAGFCYQRLSVHDDGLPFCLHGLNAVLLPELGWYRVDARGNRPDIEAAFDPPREQLAFSPRMGGEAMLRDIWPAPLPVVIEALRRYHTFDELLNHLPDVADTAGLDLILSSSSQGA